MTSPVRILLVDDNRGWRETMAEYLARQGYATAAAEDAARALRLLQQDGFALAVFDIHLPDMNGLDLLRQVRRGRRDLAVLVVSSDDDPATARKALAAGAQAFLPKTSAPSLFLRAIRAALPEKPAAARHPHPLQPWQRLLPGPRKAARSAGNGNPSCRLPGRLP